ncbi:MAG TPA: CAP domain-containing protein, partial [Candidatus Saccharimonadales bacterium]|nr:CAP domain-containing protein [Candidatus Saccharimonadales bacterium]
PKAAAPAASEIASPEACPHQTQREQAAAVIACLTSHARIYHGLGPVTSHPALVAAATAKAQDIINCRDFSHTACGRPANYWLGNKGYTGKCSGENIAQGQPTPRDVFVAWMKSPGHRANILRPGYTHIGTAVLTSSAGPVWVMELGGC